MVIAQGGVVAAAEEEERGAVFTFEAVDGGNNGGSAFLRGSEEGRGDAAQFGTEEDGFGHVDAASDAAAGYQGHVRVGGAVETQRFDGAQSPVLEGEAEGIGRVTTAVVFDAAP